jgi:hypothetical protein
VFALRGQASLETLIVLSALFAFLLAFIPVINQARELIEFAKTAGNAQAFAERFSADLKQAQLLGGGNAREWVFSLNAGELEVSFDPASNVLRMVLNYGSHSKKIEEKLGFPIFLSGESRLKKGDFVVRAKNNAGRVEASITKPVK